MGGDPGIEGCRGFFEQRELFEAGFRAACTVSSRASSSKLAGTVSTTCCSLSGDPFSALPSIAQMSR